MSSYILSSIIDFTALLKLAKEIIVKINVKYPGLLISDAPVYILHPCLANLVTIQTLYKNIRL